MSDEYSVGDAFLCGRIDEAEYWRKMARVAKREEEYEEAKEIAQTQRASQDTGFVDCTRAEASG
jgi:predicted nucleic acid-binding protein